ncbi:hypothetical protein DOY81_011707 [Sarcophaga bullata]|nr:hypothetical protein DOY81_011707 [Sarcophaga bullata]
MSCFGSCGEKKPNPADNYRVVYKKAPEVVIIETQTSDNDFPEDVHNSLVVLDCGTSKIRAGFAGQQKPLFTIPTVVCKSTVDAATTKIVGAAAFRGGMSDKITYPMEKGFIKNWHDMEDIFEYIFEHDMRIKPKMHQMLITEPFNNNANE